MGPTYEPAAAWMRMEYTTVIGPPIARSQGQHNQPTKEERERHNSPKENIGASLSKF